MEEQPAVYAVATMDTKGHELAYVARCIASRGVPVKMVDVGTRGEPQVAPDISRSEVLRGQTIDAGTDRGQAVARMGEALAEFLTEQHQRGRVAGVIGLGGSGGTSIVCTALRALPIGLPKLMVSTIASGNTAPLIDSSDILMLYSVVDIAGLNCVSRRVLGNAAAAMAGMATHSEPADDASLPLAVGMTMFGVTTECVSRVRQRLEAAGWDCLVFHATGTGGRAMEKLVESGMINAVLDITTTEVADQIAGGIMAGGPERLDRILEAGVPLVLSLGAVDMVNFGAIETVPERYRGRLLHVHNPHITLMRTDAAENRAIAAWLANKLRRARSPWVLMIPEGGVSALDAPGKPFYQPGIDGVLFDELDKQLKNCECGEVVRLPYHINDPEFADALVEAFERSCRQRGVWPQ